MSMNVNHTTEFLPRRARRALALPFLRALPDANRHERF
jgi:hypothetical protein